MRVLVVYCHPVPESYGAAIRDRILAALDEGGHETRLLDLHAIGFEPVMGAEERRRYNALRPGEHPLPEQAGHLAWCEALVFVYPTWWYGLPAMLKGWLDRVWTPGTAFGLDPETATISPLMTHVDKVAVVTTCGAPWWLSCWVGFPGRRTITRGLRALCGKRCRTLYLAHYRMDDSTAASRARFLERVERRFARF